MNIHMKIFRSQSFDPLRVVLMDDEPWYIVTDICRTLGYGNATKAVRLVRQEDKTIINVPNLSVGSNPANAVNLSGLETLILRSRKREDAAVFSRWLADTVFPIVYDDDPEPKPQDPPKETADNDLFLVHRSDYLQHLKELEKLYTMLRDVNALVASIPGRGKVRAENRDKLQIIKERAKQGKFDILLVFMFDRIGRIADETPFVVEWFVKNGIRVWSTQEGEQRFDNHTDKLTNYIRFWQADGESEKTSIRTKTALGQLVEDGGFKGGFAPYGYDLVKSGRFNKRKHEVFELAVNADEASVVRIIYDKYVQEGFGAQRIATYLNNLGYRARTGKMWHHATVRGILCNLTYTGVLRSGESRSEILPHLQIIEPELFDVAQRIRTARVNAIEQENHVPLNTRGQYLLAGNVFCGHCGSRLSLTTNGKAYPCKDDPSRVVKRVRYICYGKTRKQTECDGQTGYTAHILNDIIDKVVRQIFERMKAVPKSEVVGVRYREKMEERKALLRSVKADYTKAAAELEALKSEVVKAIKGESSFSKELLASLISDTERKCQELQAALEQAQSEYDAGEATLQSLNSQYDDMISWAEMYDSASVESKKMIVSCLIRRVDVYRGYRVHIDFNIDFKQFSLGLDIAEIAA